MPDHVSTESDTKPIGVDPNDRITQPPPTESVPEAISRIANFSERQREKNAPTIITISPNDGIPNATAILVTLSGQTTRLRIKNLIWTTQDFGTWTIAFGGRPFTFNLQDGACVSIEFPYEVDRGTDITVTRTDGNTATWSLYIVAYTE